MTAGRRATVQATESDDDSREVATYGEGGRSPMQRGGYNRAARRSGSGGRRGADAKLHLYVAAAAGAWVGGVGGLTTWLGGGDREKESRVAAGKRTNSERAGGSLPLVRRVARSLESGRWDRD
jgi:hypothetical protein